MKHLTNKEEEIMEQFWEKGPLFINDILKAFSDPKPHYNTISTVVRGLEEKGYIGHEQFGNTHRYYATVSKEEFSKLSLQNVVGKYFNHSYTSVLSLFVEEEKISSAEIKALIALVEARQKTEK